MGIDYFNHTLKGGLCTTFLKDIKGSGKTMPLRDLTDIKTIAIDASEFIYKSYKEIMINVADLNYNYSKPIQGKQYFTEFIGSLTKFIENYRKCDKVCIFVYDDSTNGNQRPLISRKRRHSNYKKRLFMEKYEKTKKIIDDYYQSHMENIPTVGQEISDVRPSADGNELTRDVPIGSLVIDGSDSSQPLISGVRCAMMMGRGSNFRTYGGRERCIETAYSYIVNAYYYGVFDRNKRKKRFIQNVDSADVKGRIYFLLKEMYIQTIKISLSLEEEECMDKILDFYHIPHIIAHDFEAEKYCCDMNFYGIVDAVASSDSDVFAYLAPTILRNMNFFSENLECEYYLLDVIVSGYNLTHEQFQNFLLLLGTDYNLFKRPYSHNKIPYIKKTYQTILASADDSSMISEDDFPETAELFKSIKKIYTRSPLEKYNIPREFIRNFP